MRWWNWLGVGLQVVGLLGAMYLLGRLKETVTENEVLLFRLWRVARRRVRAVGRWLLRRKPAPIIGEIQSALEFEHAMRAHVTSSRGAIPDGLALDDRIAWVADHVREVERKHNELSLEVSRQAGAQDDAIKATRAHAEAAMREAVDQVRSEFRQLVGKDVGWEIGWLFVVIVGIVLAAV